MAGRSTLTDNRTEVAVKATGISTPTAHPFVVCLSATRLMFTPIPPSDQITVQCMLEKLEKKEVPDVEFRFEGR